MWVKGKYQGLRYEAKVYPVPSSFGLDGGRVSKLEIYAPVYQFDRGDVGTPPIVTPNHVAAIVQEAERRTSWGRYFYDAALWANQRAGWVRLMHIAFIWLIKLFHITGSFVIAAVFFTSPELPTMFRERGSESWLAVWLGLYTAIVLVVAVSEWIVWGLSDDTGF